MNPKNTGANLSTYKRNRDIIRHRTHGFVVQHWFTKYSTQRVVKNQRVNVIHASLESKLINSLPF